MTLLAFIGFGMFAGGGLALLWLHWREQRALLRMGQESNEPNPCEQGIETDNDLRGSIYRSSQSYIQIVLFKVTNGTLMSAQCVGGSASGNTTVGGRNGGVVILREGDDADIAKQIEVEILQARMRGEW